MKKEKKNEKGDTKALEPLPIVRALFLALLKKYPGSSGYFMNKKIKDIFNETVVLRSGTVYNELRKMEKMGLVRSLLEEKKRKVRKYSLTEKGEKELSRLKKMIKTRVEEILVPLIEFMDNNGVKIDYE